MILVFITCKNASEAKKIGIALLKKRFAACCLVFPKVDSFYLWPPGKNRVKKTNEAVLLAKTLEKKFPQLEKEVKKLHSYTIPCIFEIPVKRVYKSYLRWFTAELK